MSIKWSLSYFLLHNSFLFAMYEGKENSISINDTIIAKFSNDYYYKTIDS